MKKIFFLLALSAIESNAQKKAIVNGYFPGLVENSKVYLIPDNSSPWRDSAIVKNDHFHFIVDVSNENVYDIRLTKEYEKDKWLTVYFDEGVFNITSQNVFFAKSKISGSKYAIEFNEYKNFMESDIALKNISKKISLISDKSDIAVKKNDTATVHKLWREQLLCFRKKDSIEATLTKRWIFKHSSSPISSFAVYHNIHWRKMQGDELDDILNKLQPAAKKNSAAKEIEIYIEGTKTTAIGKIAPDFTQNDTTGKPISLKDFRGKYVLLDFWASWCVPCRGENPNIVKTFLKYKDKSFTIISISLDRQDEKNDWIKAIRQDNLTWTNISDLKWWDNAIAKKYAIDRVPTNLLLDPEGKIIFKDLHGEELNNKLAALLQ